MGAAPAAVPLRAAAPADAVAIVALVRALAAHVGDVSEAKVTPEQLAAAGAGANPSWYGVVAEAEGELAGVCLYSLQFSTWVGAPGLYVIDLYVREAYRNGQLGARLLAEAARWGSERGCRFIRLEVDARNPRAHGFYERLGFQTRAGDTVFVLRNAGFDALLDDKTLAD